jgi:hypothetical protein
MAVRFMTPWTKTWRHLDFFQHKALLHTRLPRVRCPEHGVWQVSVPWHARDQGSRCYLRRWRSASLPRCRSRKSPR